MPVNILQYTAFDIETTGLYPQRGHRIIEIGAVSIQEFKIIDEFIRAQILSSPKF